MDRLAVIVTAAVLLYLLTAAPSTTQLKNFKPSAKSPVIAIAQN